MSATNEFHDRPVSRIMTPVPVTVRPDDTLQKVAEIMMENDVGVAMVGDDHEPAGIVSERDLIRAIGETRDPEVERAADVMTFDPYGVDHDQVVSKAAAIMLEGGVRHLPVLRGGRVVGMVSIRDILRAYVEG